VLLDTRLCLRTRSSTLLLECKSTPLWKYNIGNPSNTSLTSHTLYLSRSLYLSLHRWEIDDTEVKVGEKRIAKNLLMQKDGSLKMHETKTVGDASPGWGQVAKSSDGGDTWDVVYSDEKTNRYPNGIHCFDEQSCTFVMDSGGDDNSAEILTTTDGGETWTNFNLGPQSTAMTANMVGPTEAWVGAGDTVGRMWHTTDMVNWDDYPFAASDSIAVGAFAPSPGGKGGYATGILRSQQCSILKIDF
jgi:photosystem II stability/assembly factor-like uncharacterized protein